MDEIIPRVDGSSLKNEARLDYQARKSRKEGFNLACRSPKFNSCQVSCGASFEPLKPEMNHPEKLWLKLG